MQLYEYGIVHYMRYDRLFFPKKEEKVIEIHQQNVSKSRKKSYRDFWALIFFRFLLSFFFAFLIFAIVALTRTV